MSSAARGRDQQILDAAEDLFFERSFDGVGVDEIGRAAGISGSAIYRHFGSKDEILAVLFDRAVDALLMMVPSGLDDPFAQLDGLVRAHVGFAHSRHKLAAVWAKEQRCLAEPYRRAHLRRRQRYTEMWVECLSRCFPHRDREEIVTTVRGLHALLVSEAMLSSGARRPPEAAELLAELALAGVQTLRIVPTGAPNAQLADELTAPRTHRDLWRSDKAGIPDAVNKDCEA